MFRVAAATAALCLVAAFGPAAAHEQTQRLASLGLDIPGLTYPRAAPPDLVASETMGEIDFPDAVSAGVAAVAGEAPPAPTVTLKLLADLTSQRLTVMEGGEVKHVWPISSGRTGYATPPGAFRPQWASRMWYSRKYDMAPMPHAVFFNAGVAFHATQAVHLLGRPASHGCIRLSPQNARLLFALVHRHGFKATEITVTGSAVVAKAPAGRPAEKRKSGRTPAPTAANSLFPWAMF